MSPPPLGMSGCSMAGRWGGALGMSAARSAAQRGEKPLRVDPSTPLGHMSGATEGPHTPLLVSMSGAPEAPLTPSSELLCRDPNFSIEVYQLFLCRPQYCSYNSGTRPCAQELASGALMVRVRLRVRQQYVRRGHSLLARGGRGAKGDHPSAGRRDRRLITVRKIRCGVACRASVSRNALL